MRQGPNFHDRDDSALGFIYTFQVTKSKLSISYSPLPGGNPQSYSNLAASLSIINASIIHFSIQNQLLVTLAYMFICLCSQSKLYHDKEDFFVTHFKSLDTWSFC